MIWTPQLVAEVCDFLRSSASKATYNDGSYEDQLLKNLMRFFWRENEFPIQINKGRRGTCRVA